ncbi:GntR family transcriptional regulator [Streptomyces sp. VRA16 Mangrove soil]|uniref:GntR family transcriptional regulator n=1 Tax=Streptomyces sp. VRA16 Mangrove soil TaxID=2817434 RepID=UPI001A9F8194|nr:GntR family transcriptional regulator [Streptomyces sp. VRA16 Mangrove soil]MBO1330877.1 GntR family transcriptional regulator [Streptomyces sp. VRA16 Mangrove soil]
MAPTGPGDAGWLRDQVCEGIRDRIIDGQLRPGDRLLERDVAEEFGVSRIPVREAIRVLLSEGFLEAVSARKIVVKQLSFQDVLDLFDLREALEVVAVRRAAERAQQRQIDALGRLLTSAEKATRSGRADRISRANNAFHQHIVEIAGNALLASTLQPLEGRMRWLLQQVDDPSAVWQEHSALYEAIAARDVDLAADRALRHVRHYREVALDVLFDSRPADSVVPPPQ